MYDNQTSILRYREADLGSMSPEKMVVALYERVLRDLEDARTALRDGDRPAANTTITHAQTIITELRNALDHEIGGEIAANLESLYGFVFQELLQTLADTDPVHLDNCTRVLTPLLDSWRQVPAGAGEEEMRRQEGGEAETGAEPATRTSDGPVGDGHTSAAPPPGEGRLSVTV